MKLVVIESPCAGTSERETEWNVAYARRACLDAIQRGEAPFASHLLYTQFLDDSEPLERWTGIRAGFAWGAHAELVAVYVDHGISERMWLGIEKAVQRGQQIEWRKVDGTVLSPSDLSAPQLRRFTQLKEEH